MSAVIGELALRWPYLLNIVLMMLGLHAMLLKRNMVKKLIGLNVFQAGIILFYILGGYKHGASVPIIDHAIGEHAAAYMNPIPHGLMLTAIVVGVAINGVALALMIVIYRRFGTLDEDDLLLRLRTQTTETTVTSR